MQLSDFLKDSTINAIRSVSTAKPEDATFTPSLIEMQWEAVYDFSAAQGVKIAKNIWRELDRCSNSILAIKGRNVEVLQVRYDDSFARHIGHMLKTGYALLWVKWARVITWTNWKDVYKSLTHKPDPRHYDIQISRDDVERILTDRKREKFFSECAKPVGRKHKPGKCTINDMIVRHHAERKVEVETRWTYEASKIFSTCL